jgi:chitodextrinase
MILRTFAAVTLWLAVGFATGFAQTDTIPPSVPAGLAASAVASNSFTLTWTSSTDNVGVTGYEVFKDAVSLGTVNARSINVSGLAPNTTYAMKVRARDAAGNWSAQSAALSVKTLADTTPPTIPAGLTASAVTMNSFTLTWPAATDNVGVTGYEVFKGTVSLGTVNALSINVTGLALNTPYAMTVRARDAAGNWSAPSAARTVTTLADTTPPTVPAGLVASAVTINSFTLTWTASTDNVGVTGYEIFRGAVSLGTVNALSVNVTGLAPNTAYAMTVRARDAAGKWSAQSAALSVKTLPDTTPPAVPSGLAASAITATGFTLAWSASTDNVAVTGYEVFRNGVSLGTTATLTRPVTGLAPITAYALTVRARDAAGNWSAPSPALNVTTAPDTTPPAVPAGLVADAISATGFTLKWTPATDNVRVTGYEVFRDGVSVGVGTATAKTLTALKPLTAYALTVRARDAAGNWSAVSAPVSVTTLADTTAPSVPAKRFNCQARST